MSLSPHGGRASARPFESGDGCGDTPRHLELHQPEQRVRFRSRAPRGERVTFSEGVDPPRAQLVEFRERHHEYRGGHQDDLGKEGRRHSAPFAAL